MRVLLQTLGAVVALVMLAVSASMNWRFGYQLGTTNSDGQIFGGASVASDCLKALLPFFVAYAWKDARYLAVVGGSLVWVVFTGYSMTSAIGFSSLNRLEGTGLRIQQAERVTQARRTIQRVEARIAALGLHRSVGVIDAELEGVFATQYCWNGRYHSLRKITDDCATVVGRQTRQACERVGDLRQERALAAEEISLREELVRARGILGSANGVAVTGSHDTQVLMFMKLTTLAEGTVRMFLIVIIAVVVEIGSSLGMFLTIGIGQKIVARSDESEVILARRYLEENLIEEQAASVQAADIHSAYSQWIEKVSTTPPMTLTAFGRWLAGRGLEKERINGRFYYKGMRFKNAS